MLSPGCGRRHGVCNAAPERARAAGQTDTRNLTNLRYGFGQFVH